MHPADKDSRALPALRSGENPLSKTARRAVGNNDGEVKEGEVSARRLGWPPCMANESTLPCVGVGFDEAIWASPLV